MTAAEHDRQELWDAIDTAGAAITYALVRASAVGASAGLAIEALVEAKRAIDQAKAAAPDVMAKKGAA